VTSPLTAASFESPSLSARGGGAAPAYELKFLLDEERGHEVEAWARRRLALDPHGEPELGGAYRTTSLYFDTPELDVYHRTPSYRRSKFRVRRYGSMPWTFLERKSKWGDRVAKRRVAVPEHELPHLARPVAPLDWPGDWFHGNLIRRQLLPACRIAYERTAFFGSCVDGPMRLTLDRHARGIVTDNWGVTAFAEGVPLLAGQAILEFKFRSALPAPFKELVHDLRLRPSTVSKYRLCREAWGVPLPGRRVADV
jgi:hypothetical protein